MDPISNSQKIETIQNQFFSVLDDFKKYYVYYHKNPEVSEFQNFFMSSKSNLQSLNNELYMLTNGIQSNIEKLSEKITTLQGKLKNEKVLYNTLDKLSSNINIKGSTIMKNDQKTLYNQQYFMNVEMIVGVFLSGSILYYVFKRNKLT
jgi:hypothetical protein